MEKIEHMERARRNEQTLKCLLEKDSRNHGEWIVPIAYFKAVNLIDAHYASANKHFDSDKDRLEYVKRCPDFTAKLPNSEDTYYASFLILLTLCQHAMDMHHGRFAMPKHLNKFFEERLKSEVIEKHLRKIESFANHHGITIPQWSRETEQ